MDILITKEKPWIRLIGTIGGSNNLPRKLCLAINCRECKGKHSYTVKEEDWANWIGGELIQRCFTTLDENDRELFISGMCGDCFDKLFEVDND